MTDIIEPAEAALEGVTPEPWDIRDGFIYPLSIRCSLGGIRQQDARFIAAARTLVPELVAALKAARGALDRATDLLAEQAGQINAARAENQRLLADAEMWRGTQSMYRAMDKR